jgi:hypothetical protein
LNDADVMQLFLPLYADLRPEDGFQNKKPLLAHYTTIQVLEKILGNNEVWFSNPLFMNDMEEVRFGVLKSAIVQKPFYFLFRGFNSPVHRKLRASEGVKNLLR